MNSSVIPTSDTTIEFILKVLKVVEVVNFNFTPAKPQTIPLLFLTIEPELALEVA